MVRQRIELDGLRPPCCTGGDELGRGDGPMALFVRGRDGAWQVHEVARGGAHGAAAEPPRPIEPGDRAEPAPLGAGTLVGPVKAPPVSTTEITLARRGEDFVVGTERHRELFSGPFIDVPKLTSLLRELTKTPGQLIVSPDLEVPMQQVLAAVTAARAARFAAVNLVGVRGAPRLDADLQQTVAGIPDRLAWPSKPLGPMRIYDGELLVLLDGDADWGAVAPMYQACAKAGIWQVAFVCRNEDGARRKVPVPLAVDQD